MAGLKQLFTKKELAKFEEELTALRAEVLKGVQGRIASKRDESDHKEIFDLQDRASDETDREMQFLLTDRDRAKLIEIDDALRRIEDGVFGYCEESEEPIAKARLQAMPYARYTLEVQREMEELEELERARQLEEDERAYIEFSMNEPDEIDQD